MDRLQRRRYLTATQPTQHGEAAQKKAQKALQNPLFNELYVQTGSSPRAVNVFGSLRHPAAMVSNGEEKILHTTAHTKKKRKEKQFLYEQENTWNDEDL